MNIKQQLQDDMKEAMRAKDKASLATIRMIIDRVQKNEKETLRDALPDELVRIVQTFKKQTEEELTAFEQAGKLEKVADLQASLSLINKYLPKQMKIDEIEAVVVGEYMYLKNQGQLNKGNLMKAIMNQLKGRADNKLIAEVVDKVLQQ